MKSYWKSSLIGVYLILSYFIVGCSFKSYQSGESKSEERPIVLTTFTILQDLGKNVAGDRLIVRSITKPGAEIHGYQPTPSDLVRASGADLIVENGLGLELWARKFTNSSGNVKKIILTKGIKPLLIEEDFYAGKPNPHAWMSPRRTMDYVDSLVKAFSELDPESKDYFKENGRIYKQKLQLLDQELRQAISLIPKKKRFLVTCEGAFSYLANDYGMKEAYLWPVNAESQVTPRRMLNLINLIKEKEIPSIFCESTVSSKAQLEVARSTGAKFGGTFYVDSLSSSEGPAATLLDLFHHNIELIKKGLAPHLFSE